MSHRRTVRYRSWTLGVVLLLGVVGGCSSTGDTTTTSASTSTPEPAPAPSTTAAMLPTIVAPTDPAVTDAPTTTATATATATAITAADAPVTTSTAPAASPTTTPAPTSTTPAAAPLSAAGLTHRVPLGDGVHFSYGHEHHDYPASDIFARCGSSVVAPVNGTLLEVRTTDGWDPNVDNPATRGGKSIALLGDDGVRYYFAHLSAIDDGIVPEATVTIGQELGQVGQTGRASACHLHFALSPTCGGKEWKVRRGVIWPWRYLDAWKAGDDLGPIDEIKAWSQAHPDACADALAEPTAGDA